MKSNHFQKRYNRNLDNYFTFRVSDLQQTHLEQQSRYSSHAAREQLVHVHFVLFAVYQKKITTLFSETNMTENNRILMYV